MTLDRFLGSEGSSEPAHGAMDLGLQQIRTYENQIYFLIPPLLQDHIVPQKATDLVRVSAKTITRFGIAIGCFGQNDWSEATPGAVGSRGRLVRPGTRPRNPDGMAGAQREPPAPSTLEAGGLASANLSRGRSAGGLIVSLTLLLLDHDDDSRRAVARLLRRNGFSVTTASSAAQVLTMQSRFDLAVLDFELPYDDSLKLAWEFTASRSGRPPRSASS